MTQQTLLPSTGPRLLVEFTIIGEAQPQGSKIAQRRKRDGKIFMRESNRNVQEWRRHVALECAKHFPGPPFGGPVKLEVRFLRERPKGHFGTGRNAGVLKASAPEYPTAKPDADKLCRAVCDAMTGLVYADDSQIVDVHVQKRFGRRHEMTVKVYAIE